MALLFLSDSLAATLCKGISFRLLLNSAPPTRLGTRFPFFIQSGTVYRIADHRGE